MEKLYTITEASKVLYTSRVSIYEWIKTGKIKAIVLPNGIKKIRESEIKRILGN